VGYLIWFSVFFRTYWWRFGKLCPEVALGGGTSSKTWSWVAPIRLSSVALSGEKSTVTFPFPGEVAVCCPA